MGHTVHIDLHVLHIRHIGFQEWSVTVQRCIPCHIFVISMNIFCVLTYCHIRHILHTVLHTLHIFWHEMILYFSAYLTFSPKLIWVLSSNILACSFSYYAYWHIMLYLSYQLTYLFAYWIAYILHTEKIAYCAYHAYSFNLWFCILFFMLSVI